MFSLWSFCRRQGSSLVVVLTAITSALLVGHSSALLLRATQGHAPATQSGSSSSASSAQLQQGSPGSYYDAKGYAVDSKDQKQQVAFPGLYSGSSQDEKTLERKRGNRGKKKKPSATVRRNGLYSIIEDIDDKPDEVENASCLIAEVDFHRILTKFEAFAKKLFHMGRRDRPQSDHVAVLKRAFTLFITARVLARFCVDLTGNKTGSHHMPAADEESQQEKKSKDIFMATWKEMKNAIGIGHDECDVDTWKDLALQLNVEKSQRKINKARAEIVTEQPQGEDILLRIFSPINLEFSNEQVSRRTTATPSTRRLSLVVVEGESNSTLHICSRARG
ncbi:unnamed protein product [Amoebophrya sp. A25]|nr:unnamed protein product [Amoebophrya sp. A25]|eukprot:GSA25T00024067001.1